MDPDSDPDPAIFVTDLQKTNLKSLSAYYFLKLHLHHFSKIKSQKKSQNSKNQGFSYYFCMMIEESGSRPTRPKNIRIRRIWIRIRNTAPSDITCDSPQVRHPLPQCPQTDPSWRAAGPTANL